LTTESLRRTPSGILLAVLMLLSACAHTPDDGSLKGPMEEPLGVAIPPVGSDPSTAVPPAETSGTYPEQPVPGGRAIARGADAEASGMEPKPVVGLTPAQYSDLFDRIRAGFKMDDSDDRRAIDSQLNWYASNPAHLERSFGRAELYLYHIVAEVEARGMPLELALLPVVESAFEPYAYSRARASGLWQFIPGTGSRFGLKQNWWYDGRRDVVESTRAALDYLQFLHDQFDGDWKLAVAAYNCGEAAVARAVRNNIAAGKPIDFWSLKLPAETRAYVPKLIAMKRLVSDPEAHGLTFSAIPNQPYFERVWTLGQIDLRVAAEISGLKYEELYELNPAFHRWATDPTGPHFLLVPAETADAFRENVALLTEDQRMKVTRHFVAKGDSVSSVARKYNTTIQVVRELNQLPTGPLTVGTELRVPVEVVTLPPKVLRAAALVDNGGRRNRPHMHVVVRQGDSLWRIARRHGMDVNTLAMMNGMQPGDKLRTGQRLKLNESSEGGSSKESSSKSRKVTYTVRSGDTLTRIAKVFQVQVSQLLSWNSLPSNAPIVPGQKLMILVTRR
jgi:membrane-bound lytic murein transglycosylase D